MHIRISRSLRSALFLCLAAAAAGCALFMLTTQHALYQEQLVEARLPEDRVMVVHATRDLYPGVVVREDDLYYVPMPVSYLPPNVFLNAKHVVGRLPSARIIATDMVRSERLADKINGAGLNATMPHGLRAMAIPIQGVEAVAGFVRPGDYVDLLFSTRQRTETRFQALEVLAVNSRLEGETAAMASRRRGKHPPNIVFAVTPENATELATLLATSTPTLTLRNPLDQRPVETPGIGLDELMEPYRLQRDLDALRPPAKQQPAPTTVIHRGKDTEILRIETIEPVEPPEPTR